MPEKDFYGKFFKDIDTTAEVVVKKLALNVIVSTQNVDKSFTPSS